MAAEFISWISDFQIVKLGIQLFNFARTVLPGPLMSWEYYSFEWMLNMIRGKPVSNPFVIINFLMPFVFVWFLNLGEILLSVVNVNTPWPSMQGGGLRKFAFLFFFWHIFVFTVAYNIIWVRIVGGWQVDAIEACLFKPIHGQTFNGQPFKYDSSYVESVKRARWGWAFFMLGPVVIIGATSKELLAYLF